MFFKKKDTKKEVKEEVVESYDDLIQEATTLVETLDTLQGDARIDVLDQIGICYFKAKEYDQAQTYLEQSLQEKRAVAQGYRTLLNLYNIRRKEAAIAKDDLRLQYYLDKIDEMMKISKEVLRSNL